MSSSRCTPSLVSGRSARLVRHIDPRLAAQIDNRDKPYKRLPWVMGPSTRCSRRTVQHRQASCRPRCRPVPAAARPDFQMYPGPRTTSTIARFLLQESFYRVRWRALEGPLKRGDEVLRAYVTTTGPKPTDVNSRCPV